MIAAEIFKAYDIRGIVGKTLTDETARLIGRALGAEARELGVKTIVVGRDGRLSGPALAEGILASGVEYADGFGLARASNTTPVVVLRFEGDRAAALDRIRGEFTAALQDAWPGLRVTCDHGH